MLIAEGGKNMGESIFHWENGMSYTQNQRWGTFQLAPTLHPPNLRHIVLPHYLPLPLPLHHSSSHPSSILFFNLHSLAWCLPPAGWCAWGTIVPFWDFHFHLFDMIWGTLELEESKYSTESWLLNQLLLTMLVQPIYLPEVNEAYQSTCPDGKINQYKLQHFKRTEQQHNFFRVPFSFAEKNSHSQRQNI